ncbi:MAG: hypothetical protein ACI9XC_001711 [Gammaproteobacteria bacterium]|jgi:hypothetical protein
MAEQSTLRTLAKAYANGQIEKEKYRADRTAFLDTVLSGSITLPVSGHSPLIGNENVNDITTQKGDKPRKYTATTSIKTKEDGGFLKQKSTLLYGGISLVVVIIIIVALTTGGDDTSNQTTPGQVSSNNSTSNTQPSRAQNLISSFLSDNNWTQSSQDVFLLNWRGISETERSSAMSSPEFSRFINEIYKKLLEERALSRIGNPETSYEKQRQLVEFASTIGINDQRISLPDAPSLMNQ